VTYAHVITASGGNRERTDLRSEMHRLGLKRADFRTVGNEAEKGK